MGRPRERASANLIAGLTVLAVLSSGPATGTQEQEQVLPAQLLEGGNIYLVNDLQAFADSMVVFRQFRRDLRRLDRFEEVDDREEAELVGMLTADPDVADRLGLVSREIPYPSGLRTRKIMLFVIYDADTNNLLYFDAVDWDTRETATSRASHTKLVQRLKAALDGSG